MKILIQKKNKEMNNNNDNKNNQIDKQNNENKEIEIEKEQIISEKSPKDENNINQKLINDINQMRIISCIGGKHKNPITCIRKIEHNEYGKCIITSRTDKIIIIWN